MVYAFWLHANRHSVLRRYGFDLRCSYENAALLTAATEEALGDDGDACLDRKQMKETMQRAGNVGLVIGQNRPVSGGGPIEIYMTTYKQGTRILESVERLLRPSRRRHRRQTSIWVESGQKKPQAFWDSGRPFVTDALKDPSPTIRESIGMAI